MSENEHELTPEDIQRVAHEYNGLMLSDVRSREILDELPPGEYEEEQLAERISEWLEHRTEPL